MSALFEAASDLQTLLEKGGLRFCFIGGLAVLRWGAPRFTRDVDVSVFCPFGSEDDVSLMLLNAKYKPRIPDTREFARRSRVVLLEALNGVPIDIALAALPYEEGLLDRATAFELEAGRSLRTCSAEDLVIMKLFAFRPRDVVDVESVVLRQDKALDWPYIESNLRALAEVKEEPGIMAEFERLRGGR